MAKASRSTGSKRSSARTKTRRAASGNGAKTDAITLLKADHRQVEQWFEQFEKARSDDRKQDLAQKICKALTVHAQIEEEIFYPAFLEATDETDIHHEAEVEHDGAKKLIAEIESAGADDEYFDARVTVLKEMVKHHVNEEEKRGGMFTKAKQAEMDLADLGMQLKQRKDQLMSESGMAGEEMADEGMTAALVGRRGRGTREGARKAH